MTDGVQTSSTLWLYWSETKKVRKTVNQSPRAMTLLHVCQMEQNLNLDLQLNNIQLPCNNKSRELNSKTFSKSRDYNSTKS